jgi:NAD(P)-dependent dehydrogenase (short-subunit alcohol dehydrogenase family)
MFGLAGRSVLVTGAASGIGAATARLGARLGARLVLLDLQPLDDVVEAVRAAGGTAVAQRCDVAMRAEVEVAVAAAGPLDGLVVSAAICPWEDWRAPGWEESFHRVMEVNLLGALNVARAVLPGMIARGRGRIVLVGSLAGRMGGLIAGPHYVASKGGLHALVKWLAQQGGPHGVTVNGVAPASIATPMMAGRPVDTSRIPLGRMGRAEEVAGPIAFLLSDAASYVTGTVLDVNGGVWMAP